MSKRILVTVAPSVYRRFRVLAAQHSVTNARLLELLLDAHERLLDFQADRCAGSLSPAQLQLIDEARSQHGPLRGPVLDSVVTAVVDRLSEAGAARGEVVP